MGHFWNFIAWFYCDPSNQSRVKLDGHVILLLSGLGFGKFIKDYFLPTQGSHKKIETPLHVGIFIGLQTQKLANLQLKMQK